jgi:uncharacterized lipoprotein YmbA
MMRTLLLTVAALALCACATPAPPPAPMAAANAVYVVPEGANTTAQAVSVQPAQLNTNDPLSPGASPLMHIYWFLGGR